MKKPKRYSLVVNFATLEEIVDFASTFVPAGVSIYAADALDPEFTGNAPSGSLVLRRDGAKPDDMRIV